jgi:hypothetical protein
MKKNLPQKKRKNFLLMKLSTKPLKFKCGLADGGNLNAGWPMGGWVGWWILAKHGYSHLVLKKSKKCNLLMIIFDMNVDFFRWVYTKSLTRNFVKQGNTLEAAKILAKAKWANKFHPTKLIALKNQIITGKKRCSNLSNLNLT